MKIALLGSKDFDSLEFHINDSLTFLGHEVFHIDIKDVINIPYRYNYWGQKLFPKYDEFVFRKIARKIVEQMPDLVICTYRFINPNCIIYIKNNLKVPVIQINPDALTTFENQQVFASPYDAYFTKDPFIVDFMKNKMGLNTLFLPEAFNQRIHKPPQSIKNRIDYEKKIDCDVVAFGTMYPYRSNVIGQLIDSGINIDLYGTPDRKFPQKKIQDSFKNRYITGDAKSEVLYGAKIVFNNFHYAEVECTNVKFFEIMGIGAFQICDYKPVIAEYSNLPVEKFTFKNINEAKDLIGYYMERPEERHAIAEQQLTHFLANHTYDIRMEEMLKMI